VSWVKLDDHFPEHPKVAHVGMVGMALQVAALCYSARNLTDGHIPAVMVPKLTGMTPKQSKTLAARMVEAGLWDLETGVGGLEYVIHDYLEYNPSRASVLQKRDADLKRKGYRGRHDS
jgi:hypothetical protein